jgi:hypothetical protein
MKHEKSPLIRPALTILSSNTRAQLQKLRI